MPPKRRARDAETPERRRTAPRRSLSGSPLSPGGPSAAGGEALRPWCLRCLPDSCFHVRAPDARIPRAHCVVRPLLRNVAGDYVHAMFQDVIRDGDISDSEQSQMLWAIIIGAQIQASGAGDATITIPAEVRAGEGALRAYMQSRRGEINDFMKLVKPQGWIRALSEEHQEHKQGFLARPLGALTDRVIALIGYDTRKHSFSDFDSEELLSAFEKPGELTFHWVTSAVLRFLEPLAPSKYLFRLRLADLCKFYGAQSSKDLSRSEFWSTLLKGLYFVIVCLVYTSLLGLVAFLRTFLYLRVFLCVGMGIPLIGQGACAVNLLVERWTEWNHSNAWVGCPEERSSYFQLLSGALAQLILELLVWVEVAIPCTTFMASFCIMYRSWCLHHGMKRRFAVLVGALFTVLLAGTAWSPAWLVWVWTADSMSELILIDDVLRSVHVLLRRVLDFCFTVLLVNLLGKLNGAMDEIVQPKLLLASLSLGAELRRGGSHARGG